MFYTPKERPYRAKEGRIDLLLSLCLSDSEGTNPILREIEKGSVCPPSSTSFCGSLLFFASFSIWKGSWEGERALGGRTDALAAPSRSDRDRRHDWPGGAGEWAVGVPRVLRLFVATDVPGRAAGDTPFLLPPTWPLRSASSFRATSPGPFGRTEDQGRHTAPAASGARKFPVRPRRPGPPRPSVLARGGSSRDCSASSWGSAAAFTRL